MAMVVKNNMSAVSTLNTLNKNSSALQKSLQKVSSGMKINSAQDDASGYAISEKMRVQIRSLDQANQNTQNASSLMKTAEGAVSSTVEILKSLKEKAINAATDTNTDADRATIQKELDQFIDQIDDNALTTFNGKYLVDGSKNNAHMNTRSAFTNQSMAIGTTGNTYLADDNSKGSTDTAKNRTGESLEITSTDYVTASFVKDGKTYTTTYQVADTKVQDIFTKMNEEYAAKEPNATEPAFGGTATVEEMTYADALAAVQAASNEDFAKIIAGDSNSDSTLGDALKKVYNTNVDGTTDASGKNDVTDQLSKDLIAARDAIAVKLDAGKGIASQTNVGTGGYQASQTTVGWKDADGNAVTTTKDAWNAGGTTASTSAYNDFIQDAQDAVGKWASGTGIQGSAAGEAAADVLTSLTDGSNAMGAAAADFRFDQVLTQNLAKTELAVEAAAKVNGLRKEEPFTPHYVGTDGNEDTVATGKEYEMAQKYSLTDAQANALGASTNDEAGLKAALDVAISNVNGSSGGNISDATKQLKADKYIASRADAITQGNFASTTVSNATQAWNALDKADALYNAWQAAKANPENPNATAAASTTTGPAHDENTPKPTDLVHQGSDIGTNKSDDTVYTNDGTEGLTVTAATAGLAGQISGVTISISDSDGNVKKAANAALDQFKMSIRAENRTTAVDGNNNLTFQVGAAANQAISVSITDMRSEALGLKGSDGTKVSVATKDKANAAVAVFDNAIQKAIDQQTTIGAVEARLEYTGSNLTTMSENVQAAESTIRDADMAKEMTNYTKNNVLLQAAQSMLAQANQSSSQVLSLLQ